MYKNHMIYKRGKVILSLLFLLLIGISSSVAQTNMTKIKDGTLSGTTTTPGLGVILELESVNKGFLTPRLTTQQRDAITAANRTDGLLIFNKTTGCFNYWSTVQDSWLSICGTPPPAVFEINQIQCQAITVNGILKQGEFLTAANYLTIPVTVTQPGTYEVKALTDNGYYFTTSGTFPSAGSYTLVLQGIGTPNIGYSTGEQGDLLTISLNNVTAQCQQYAFVENATVSYSIDCAQVRVLGDYMIGMSLKPTNKMVLSVNVTSTGYWSISTNTTNGYSFRGSGTFSATGVQEIELLGTGTPIQSGTDTFGFTTNSDVTTRESCTDIQVQVKEVDYRVDCSNVVFTGVYKQDEPTTASHTAKLSVEVRSTGETVLETEEVNGIYFTSGPLSFDGLTTREVVLTAVGTPIQAGTFEYVLKPQTGMEAICSFELTVTSQPVSYTLLCSSIATVGDYAPGVPMTPMNIMLVQVNVSYPGPYTISTNTVNGIRFEATGTFNTTGTQTVQLRGIGTPLTGGIHRYTITSDSVIGANTCNKNIDFLFRRMKVLGLGSLGYQPGSAAAKYSVGTMLKTPANFGPNGIVKVDGVDVYDGGTSQGNTLRDHINSNNIDIIVVGYNYRPNAASIAILSDFVKNKKGVLLHGQENDPTGARDLINSIAHSASTSVTEIKKVWVNPIFNTTDPVLDGPFGNIVGLNLGGDLDNSLYVEGYSNEFTPLSYQTGNSNSIWALKHNTLGFIFIGDGGWVAGDVSNTSTLKWPAPRTSGGAPVSKMYHNNTTVHNSIFYTNALAWAMQYVQANINVNYTVR
ncbi:hypothetical protein [Myroides sp. DF42-4-2]|uniref:hypothetical protein n=1 Tax=unclassified Myroides TaxID=2642485 RepID=UPI0025768066|nr:hypothetical protein [Myroides sp. DF42-4-2]MDM1409005.1 hypothetical protein [Myroides sp. DF42-4-2]